MSLVIELSDEFVRAVRIPEAELAADGWKELAMAFYAWGSVMRCPEKHPPRLQ